MVMKERFEGDVHSRRLLNAQHVVAQTCCMGVARQQRGEGSIVAREDEPRSDRPDGSRRHTGALGADSLVSSIQGETPGRPFERARLRKEPSKRFEFGDLTGIRTAPAVRAQARMEQHLLDQLALQTEEITTDPARLRTDARKDVAPRVHCSLSLSALACGVAGSGCNTRNH